jgi:hypothetical protein
VAQQVRAFPHDRPKSVLIGQHALAFRCSPPATGSGEGSGTATLTITFTNFGAPVRLSPPPSGQTANIMKQALQRVKAGSS